MSDHTETTPGGQPSGQAKPTGFWYRIKSPWRQLLAFGLLLGALGAVALFSALQGGTESEAKQQCQDRVEFQLKSPSTADFGASSVSELGSTGDRWEVAGVVDAENSFGGTVRLTYKCDMSYDDETDSWDAALVDVRE